MPPSRIIFLRHGQGQHNMAPLEKNRLIHDARLTDYGVQRCKAYSEGFPLKANIELYCASPMTRTIQTALCCFSDSIPRTVTKKLLLLPDAQETTDLPCDVGSPVSTLREEFGEIIDTHLVSEEWTSKKGVYATDPSSLRARAKALRQWLWKRPESEILVVSHGAILDYVVEDNLDENGVFMGEMMWII